jgi:NAD(P) transhydrogenase subunit alpha
MAVVAILKERAAGETRVAATPDSVRKLIAMGCEVRVETGAGAGASIPDAEYQSAGASIARTAAAALKDADILFKVRAPDASDIGALKKGALVAALLNPHQDRKTLDAIARTGAVALAMEFVPRISRAQSMDALSSQANLAGYRAVIEGAQAYGRAMPMMMTAAGTVAAAKVFVMGVGVAGLQAIATARRLGAVVTATDVRPATKEQVESLGAKFVAVEDEEFKNAQTAGGYAKEMSKEYQAKQAALVSEHIKKQDIVITTALIPGRPAPRLVNATQVASMKPGSVLVDLAIEQGGNVEGAKIGQTVVTANGATILGHANLPGRIAADASALYAKNLVNLAALLIKDGALNPDWTDEILVGAVVATGGKVTHPALAPVAEASKPAVAPEAPAAPKSKAAKPASARAPAAKPVATKSTAPKPAKAAPGKKPTAKKG